jgi:hypothetical protein
MFRRWDFAAGYALVLGCLAGCFQGEEKTTLYPDGSGKIEFTMSVKKSLMKMVEAAAKSRGEPRLAPDALDGLDRPERLARMADGIVAWRVRPRREDGEWIHFSFTGYFEDVNRVAVYEDQPQAGGLVARQKTLSFRYERRPGGGTLAVERSKGVEKISELRNRGPQPEGAEAEGVKAMAELMRPVLQDFRYAVSLTVPGRIERAEGLSPGDGRTARFVLDGEAILGAVAAPQGPGLERLARFAQGTVSWSGEGEVPEDWKKERAAAKEEWARARGLGAAAPPPPAEAGKPPARRESLGADADRLSDEEVNRAYARAQIKTAQAYLRGGKTKQAREVLESLLAEFPKLPESEEARRLLEGLKKP